MTLTLNSKQRSWLIPILLPLFTFGLMLVVQPTRIGKQLENVTEDWRFQERKKFDESLGSDSSIVVVGIDEDSLRTVGRWEDWTRTTHAQFCQAMLARPPKVLAYDLFFSENSIPPDHDAAFASSLELYPGAITCAVAYTGEVEATPFEEDAIGKTEPIENVLGDRALILGGSNGDLPIQSIAEVAWTGFANTPPSTVDGIRRVIPMVVRLGDHIYPSLCLQTIMQKSEAIPKHVKVELGKAITISDPDGSNDAAPLYVIPIDDKGFLRINYRSRRAFQTVGLGQAFRSLVAHANGEPWNSDTPDFKNSIVFIGQTAEGLADLGETPYGPLEPLVYTHAVAVNSILSNDYLYQAKHWPVYIGWLLIALATCLWLHRAKIWAALAVPLIIALLYTALSVFLFHYQSILLPMAIPLLGFVGIHGATITHRLFSETQARRHTRSVLGTYVSEEVVEKLLASGEMPTLGGENRVITVFFSDIQGFSSFSEKLTPQQLVDLMIRYLSEMTEILMANGGLLDKYIGDAIVGMFGALVKLEDHAYLAVKSAIAIQKRQYELCEIWREEGHWPEEISFMQTRIGLNTGEAVTGNMGSSRRLNFTMMGDTVNLAARCESGAKAYGVCVMITSDTRDAAMETADDIEYRFLDRLIVKGRTVAVDMYEVIGFKKDISPNIKEMLRIFHQGIDHYQKMEWDLAFEAFEKSSRIEPWQPDLHPGVSTNPSLVMMERSRTMKQDPPEAGWNGVYEMTTK